MSSSDRSSGGSAGTDDPSDESPPSVGRRRQNKKSKIEERFKNLSEYTKRNGKIFTVSRLHNLDVREVAIKSYKKTIRERIRGVLASRTGATYKVDAIFELRKGLAETRHDEDTICIEVVVTPPTEEDNDEVYRVEDAKSVYLGYLISRGRDKAYKYAAQLPVLLSFKGTNSIVSSINSTLEVLFDCIVRPFEFCSEYMEQILVKCLTVSTEDKPTIVLGVTAPNFKNDEIAELALLAENFKDLQRILKTSNEEELQRRSQALFENFYLGMRENSKMNLSRCSLIKFKLQGIILHNSGKFLISNTEVMAVFLRSICQLCLSIEVDHLSRVGLT
ncbi:uncharacterized protein LOC132200440 [Neocloeon triangulifer]|uniref:uncharacterized protein LOC132200440 n=1 Tax=Neocloeon triangulifer TaxID=2078957 RepID=UPI00286EF657|nr:uncharacterized protein LOC132200440 [Neocloeon triangulifer]